MAERTTILVVTAARVALQVLAIKKSSFGARNSITTPKASSLRSTAAFGRFNCGSDARDAAAERFFAMVAADRFFGGSAENDL